MRQKKNRSSSGTSLQPAAHFLFTLIVWSLVGTWIYLAAYVQNQPTTTQPGSAAAAAAAAADDSAPRELRLQPQTYHGASDIVVITTTSSPYLEFTQNWAAHLARLGVKHAVIALDSRSVTVLTEQRVPAVLDASEQAQQLGLTTDSSVRKDYARLRHLGYLRIGLPLQLMQQYQWQHMLLSDADVVWLKHPAELLGLCPTADLMVSTDCLSVEAVAQQHADVSRCGAQPGGWNSAWNSGVIVVRNNLKAVAVLTAWRDDMAPGSVSKSPEGWWIDDQLALTRLLDAESLPFQGADDAEPSAAAAAAGTAAADLANTSSTTAVATLTRASSIWAWKRQLKVVALPPLVIAGGHVALHQHLPEAYNITPWAVHFTYQAKYDAEGKVSRARESNLWLIDAPEPPGARYLTYHNMVDSYLTELEVVWQQHTGRSLAQLHKHQLAAAFQLQVLAEALAAAHVLNRTLVPPPMTCFCTVDSSAWTDTLKTCAIAGSDKLPPFQCTLENLIYVVAQQRSYAHALKTPNFLANSRVARLVRDSTVRVQWSAQPDTVHRDPVPAPDLLTVQLLAAMKATAGSSAAAGSPQAVQLPLRVSEAQLRQALAGPHAATAVVDLGPVAPGWFAGLEATDSLAEVQQMVGDLTASVGWCCLLEAEEGQNMDHAYVHFQHPVVPTANNNDAQPEARGRAAWMPAAALFQRPAWCSRDYLRPLNWNVSMRPQHPCAYLPEDAAGTAVSDTFVKGLAAALYRVHEARS